MRLDNSITLREDNMFSYNSRIVVHSDGTHSLIREPIDWQPTEDDAYHIIKGKETLRMIAFDRYKEFTQKPENYWWLIADANDILNPLDITPGEELLIPHFPNFKLIYG